MTKTIKANLMRVLMVIVALTCAFGIITMPMSTAKADASTPTQEQFYVDENVQIRGDSAETSGMRFTAWVSEAWFNEFKALEANAGKSFRFGIVIDNKLPEVDGEDVINISYLTDSTISFAEGSASMNASITYNIDALKSDLRQDPIYTQGKEGDALEEMLDEYVLMMNATRLTARGYIQVLDGTTVTNTVYTANAVTRSMMEVTSGKLEEGVIGSEVPGTEWIVTKYIGVISEASAFIDSTNGKVYGVDFTGYKSFALGQQPFDVTVNGGNLQFTLDSLEFVESKLGKLNIGQDYAFTAFDSENNALKVSAKYVTKVITKADELEQIFDLSDFQPDVVKYANGAAGETIIRSVDGYYVLGCDIDASVTEDGDALYMHHNLVAQSDPNAVTQYHGGMGFKGTFDGRGYTISNLNLVRTATKTPYIYEVRNNALGGRLYYGTEASSPTTSTYIANFTSDGVRYDVVRTYKVAFDTSLEATQSNGAGLFGVIDNATIKNVAFTNVICDNGNVLAKVGTATKQQTAFLQEVDVATIKQATGKEEIYSYVGGTFVKEDDTAKISVRSVYNKNTNPNGGADWSGNGTFITDVYVEISKNSTKIRGAMWDDGAFANSTLTNVIIEYLGGEGEITQAKLDTSRGVRNGVLGGRFENADKATSSISFNNVVIIAPYYPVLASSASATGYAGQNDKYMYYGENEIGKADFFGAGVVPAVGADNTNRTLKGVNKFASYEEYYKGVNGVLTDTDSDPETPDELVYSKASNYDATLFNSKYWSNIMGVPSWRSSLNNSLVVTLDETVIEDGYYIALDRTATGETYNVAVKDVIGNDVENVAYASSNTQVATFENGVITITGTTQKEADSAVLTFTVDGYTFTINVDFMGYKLLTEAITYSEKNQLFNFGNNSIDPDGVAGSGDEIVLTNETIAGVTVLADTGAVELTRTERQVQTAGTSTTDDTSDDVYTTYVDFGGWTVPFTVEKGEDGYITTPFSSKLLIKVEISEGEYATYLATNFTAYTGIITNASQFSWLVAESVSDAHVTGYFILANNIDCYSSQTDLRTALKGRGTNIINSISGVSIEKISAFQGVFDGQGYKLDKFRTNDNYASFFGFVRSTAQQLTSIKNFAIRMQTITRIGILAAQQPYTDDTNGTNAAEFKNIYFYNTETSSYTTSQGAGLFPVRNGSYAKSFKLINCVADFTNLNTYDDKTPDVLGDIYDPNGLKNCGLEAWQQLGMLVSEQANTAVGTVAKAAYSHDMFVNSITISRTPAMIGIADRRSVGYAENKIGKATYPIIVGNWSNASNNHTYTLATVSNVLEVITDETAAGYGYRSKTSAYVTGAGSDGIPGNDDDTTVDVREYILKGLKSYDDANDIAAALTENPDVFKALTDTGFFKIKTSGTGKLLTWHSL